MYVYIINDTVYIKWCRINFNVIFFYYSCERNVILLNGLNTAPEIMHTGQNQISDTVKLGKYITVNKHRSLTIFHVID